MCCLNAQCNAYGQRGQANLTVCKTCGADRIRYLRCPCCGEAQALSVIKHLDSACGLNATPRLVGVSKDAVCRLLCVGGPDQLSTA